MKRLLLIIIALFFVASGFAQQRNRFDDALDQYEAICARCQELRDAMDRGETVSQEEIRSILEQISTLRTILGEASGEMSQEQRERFNSIRNRFLASGQQLIPALGALVDTVLWRAEPVNIQPVPIKGKDRLNGVVLGSIGINAHPDFGVMAVAGYGKWGGYLSARMRTEPGLYDYECNSNGDTSYGKIWTSGKSFHPGWRFTLGPAYMLSPRWRVYAGAGYGRTLLIWEDIDGGRALVTDLARGGLALEAGALYSHGHLAAAAGLSSLMFRDFCPVLSVGYRF